MSPDGTSLYVASFLEGDGGDVAIIDVDPQSGNIEQKAVDPQGASRT
jgi:hypothetical protein